MGTYSELLTDENILRGVGDAKSIVVLGCPNCANLSIAYSKNIASVGKSSWGDSSINHTRLLKRLVV